MSGYKIKFNGLDRLYEYYKTDFNEAAQKSWTRGKAILGEETEKLENNIAPVVNSTIFDAIMAKEYGVFAEDVLNENPVIMMEEPKSIWTQSPIILQVES
jgi:hypothetical protein